jgi:hypothetical protein
LDDFIGNIGMLAQQVGPRLPLRDTSHVSSKSATSIQSNWTKACMYERSAAKELFDVALKKRFSQTMLTLRLLLWDAHALS